VHQQVDRGDVLAGQIAASKPEALAMFLDEVSEGSPALRLREEQAGIRLLR